ncbi:hypothetical protein [Bradyrhizobium liaoningense]|uniref:hypothetical protein n=1 Tax=Bradyrhizobium liaoningense TaxID=43992 RepID=UPI001BAE03CC|nr:hypothetical protein [Bradyrhizobium liaoningense]
MKSIIPAADASAAPASNSAIAVIGAAKNRIIISPRKKRFNRSQRPYLRAFRKPRAREGRIVNDWRYQIATAPICWKALAKSAPRHAGQGRNARYCFDGPREQ